MQEEEDWTAKETFRKFKDSLRVIRKMTQGNVGSFYGLTTSTYFLYFKKNTKTDF